jgi:two-component system response regulator AtoC
MRVLIVDDEPGLRQSLGMLLTDAGYHVTAEGDGKRALERASRESFDLILCDVRMPELDGLGFLRSYRQAGGMGLVIMMSAYGAEDGAIAAMKEGAYDYIAKPFRPDEVILTLRKAEERERLGRTVATLRAQLEAPERRAFIAESDAMKAVLELVGRVAGHKTTILITGESGTGKEVVAQAIHRASPRAAKPFVAINCAAIPAALLESELFGHVRGSFTGANADKPGLFEQAEGGTLLLDEIGELPLELQAKLLRVLQEGEVRRVGDSRTRQVDVRVLAATAKNLEREVNAGRFREDLFYRVNVVSIALPALARRQSDIAPLARYFADQLARRLGKPLELSAEAITWLEGQPWPGNVRQLQHALERAAVLSERSRLLPEDFMGGGAEGGASVESGAVTNGGLSVSGTLREAMDIAERQAIESALAAVGGNRRAAAERLGISLRTLFYKIDRLHLE